MKRILIADDHSFIRVGLIQIIRDEYPTAIIGEVGDADSLIQKVIHDEWVDAKQPALIEKWRGIQK